MKTLDMTPIEDKNLILQDIQKKLNDLEQRILQEEGPSIFKIFGQSFFSSIQTTSPFHLANISDSYILGPGDAEVSIISSTESDIHMLTVNQKGQLLFQMSEKLTYQILMLVKHLKFCRHMLDQSLLEPKFLLL